MRHLHQVPESDEPKTDKLELAAAYTVVERLAANKTLEFALSGPTAPNEETTLAVRADDLDAVLRARETMRELAESRNQDVAFGAAQAYARVNALIDELIIRNDGPVILDRAQLAPIGGAAAKTCAAGSAGTREIGRARTYTDAIAAVGSGSER